MGFLSKKYSTNVCYIDKGSLVNGNLFPKTLQKPTLICKKCISVRNDHKDDYKKCNKCITCDRCNKRIAENKKPTKNCKTCHKPCISKANKICHRKCKRECSVLNKSDGDFSIIQGKDKKYYACIVVLPTDEILDTKQNICALDPGVRTFQTMYSQDSIGEFGYDTSKTLYNLYKREDKIKSALVTDTTIKSKKRYKLKKRCALLRTKIKNITNDLHWKTADYLTKNYQVILLPIFNSKQMANKKNRKISKTSTRLMLGLSHYDFQQKLLYKAKQRGRNVILCKEHYTTKCCGGCGTLNETIGSKKIFQCENCDLIMDRDTHAARNILIRALSIYFDNTLG
jgi:IS605 OrfB family transposase